MRNKDDDLEKSEGLLDEAVKICMERNDTWSADYCYEILGQIYMRCGEFENALNITMTAYEDLVRQLGKQHADIANNRLFQANIYRSMGEEEQARAIYSEAAVIYEKCGLKSFAGGARKICDSGKIGYLS